VGELPGSSFLVFRDLLPSSVRSKILPRHEVVFAFLFLPALTLRLSSFRVFPGERFFSLLLLFSFPSPPHVFASLMQCRMPLSGSTHILLAVCEENAKPFFLSLFSLQISVRWPFFFLNEFIVSSSFLHLPKSHAYVSKSWDRFDCPGLFSLASVLQTTRACLLS